MNTTMKVVSLTAKPAASKNPNSEGSSSRGRSRNRTITTIMARVMNAVRESSRPSRVMYRAMGLKASTAQATRVTTGPSDRRKNHGKTIIPTPARTATMRAVVCDSPNLQKSPAVR